MAGSSPRANRLPEHPAVTIDAVAVVVPPPSPHPPRTATGSLPPPWRACCCPRCTAAGCCRPRRHGVECLLVDATSTPPPPPPSPPPVPSPTPPLEPQLPGTTTTWATCKTTTPAPGTTVMRGTHRRTRSLGAFWARSAATPPPKQAATLPTSSSAQQGTVEEVITGLCETERRRSICPSSTIPSCAGRPRASSARAGSDWQAFGCPPCSPLSADKTRLWSKGHPSAPTNKPPHVSCVRSSGLADHIQSRCLGEDPLPDRDRAVGLAPACP